MSKKKTTEEFIKDAITKHGMKYQYTKVVYKTNKDKVIITCPEHGDFEQRPNDHLTGYSCMACTNQNKGIIISKTKAGKYRTFTEWDSYIKDNYPRLKLINILNDHSIRKGKMELECTLHSHKFITSTATVAKSNKMLCPICVRQKHQKQPDTYSETELYVYLLYLPQFGMYKLGLSKDPSKRLKYRNEIVWQRLLPKVEAINFEHWVHTMYEDHRYCGTIKLIGAGTTELYTTKILTDGESLYERFRHSME